MRTIHIGNIANNAYLAARKERQLGIDAHAVSIDYTHIMGFPEWEEIEILRSVDSHFIDNLMTSDFERPIWFHSGSIQQVYESIVSKENVSKFSEHEVVLGEENADYLKKATSVLKSKILLYLNSIVNYFWRKTRRLLKKIIPLRHRALVIGNFLYFFRKYTTSTKILNEIVQNFDFVTLYGPSASIGGYLKDHTFITLEHGTLRDYVDTKYLAAKETKRGFQLSQVTLVTNQDCLPKALKMGLENPICTPHPINDDDFPMLRDFRTKFLKNESRQKAIVVPARHTIPLDIDVGKGSEIIYAAIEILANDDNTIVFDLIEWGDALSVAKERLRPLEQSGQVRWNKLMSRPLLKKLIASSSGVIDQLKIPAYGAITADALGIGAPVITRHLCKNDINFFGNCAPILAADSVESLVSQIRYITSLSESDLLKIMDTNTEWFDQNLSSDVAHSKRIEAYKVINSLKHHD